MAYDPIDRYDYPGPAYTKTTYPVAGASPELRDASGAVGMRMGLDEFMGGSGGGGGGGGGSAPEIIDSSSLAPGSPRLMQPPKSSGSGIGGILKLFGGV